jgi:uncharacterized membrane protein (DUF485 family)
VWQADGFLRTSAPACVTRACGWNLDAGIIWSRSYVAAEACPDALAQEQADQGRGPGRSFGGPRENSPRAASSGYDYAQTGRQPLADHSRAPLTSRELLESHDFRHLVGRRWRVALALTFTLFVVYYGFILLVATQRNLLARRVGQVTTLGIVLGVAVLLLAWVLTAAYVLWANRRYDPEVQRLRDRLRT